MYKGIVYSRLLKPSEGNLLEKVQNNNNPMLYKRHHDAQHDDTQHNDIQHNDTQHNDTQHIDIQHNDIQHNDTQLNSK